MQSRFDYMSNGQLRVNAVNDPRVLLAMSAVPRERFVPARLVGGAYVDEDISLGHNRWMIEPLVFATLLQLAAIKPTDRVLLVGGGLGYSAAVVAHLARNVVMVEEVDALSVEARGLLSGQGTGSIDVVTAPLAIGAPALAPYDVIVIEGGAEEIPVALKAQLRDGGRLVGLHAAPSRQPTALSAYVVIERDGDVYAARQEGSAFTHTLSSFARKPVFSL